MSVFETTVEAGPPLHVHDRDDECFYVLDGELSVRCGSDVFDAPAGSFVFLPRGRPHRFWARDTSARLLLIVVPGGIEDYFGQINNASDEASSTGSASCTASGSYPTEPAATPYGAVAATPRGRYSRMSIACASRSRST